MTDYSELKRLAQAAPKGPWYGPDTTAHKGTVFDCDLGSLLCYESIESEQDACVAYVAAANPAAVLALIAEVEEDAMHMRAFGDVMKSQAAQIEQLKAEVETLRKHAPSSEMTWCACGDGYPANSYGAGFMDASSGVCENCSAAMNKEVGQ